MRSKLADSPGAQEQLNEISEWVKQQKEKGKYEGKKERTSLEEVGKLLKTTVSSIEKFKSKDPLKITTGVLEIVSSLTSLVDVGKPHAAVIRNLWMLLTWLLTERQPEQLSVVNQMAKAVHDEMVRFNERLQDQKYNGLKRRVSDQIFQLQEMRRGEKLDDPDLWNDYVQFLGELASRFEAPIPFKYEYNLTEDPDVKDFITAVVTYAEAHCCLMALLFVARAKYTDFGITYQHDIDAVDRKLNCQRMDAKEKLSFLSEERYLTFLGRIEGGKLTKIVALSRSIRSKSLVEAVRRSLELSPMPDLSTVESAAKKVALQSVKLSVLAERCNWFYQYFGNRFSIQFINDVDFPMKIVSGVEGRTRGKELTFVQDVRPRQRYQRWIPHNFSTAGYFILYLNNIVGSDVEPPREDSMIIEFAVSSVFFDNKIGMQDKTHAEFYRGLDTYNKRSEEPITRYISEGGKHYMLRAEIYVCWPDRIWRFIIQDFDPEAVRD